LFCIQISERAQPSFHNKKKFLERIDNLPDGVNWDCEDLEITGDEPDLEADPSGNTMRKEFSSSGTAILSIVLEN
jgi:hypothetical protein